jgi:wobble nucleotide-excising tRNase
LGHGDVKLQSIEDGYQLIRADGEPASNLSEGEKTGLAFCFFLTQFDAEGRNKKDLVVVIDDPISSLDTAAKTHAFSLMRKMTKKCAQTIILTHNMSFMNMVKREFRNENSDKKSGLLQIKCQGNSDKSRQSSLCEMNKLLADYDTEYHYLFELVFNAHKNKGSEFQFLLPNATRKMLEMFVAFAAPAQRSFAGALGESGVTLVQNNLKSLERLVQIESHGTMDGMDSLPALNVEEAIKACSAAMEFIQKRDPKHYKAMKKLCENA